MRPAGRAVLPPLLLLLLLLLVPPSAEAAGLRVPSLRGSSSGARPRAGGVPALLLLLAERPPHPSAAGGGEAEAGPAGERPRRDDPALSIDLTFHLLRTLLELARTQSQRERAEQNRVLFEAVGK